MDPSDMLLKDDDPEEEYRRRKDEDKTTISWGQRKLLLIFVSFLSNHLDKEVKNPCILYIGAAPGVNINIVLNLFPHITIHAYDPRPFKIKKNKRIFIYQKKFTSQIAKFWAQEQRKKKNIYLISDIRTADYTKSKDLSENETQILEDMKLQREWVEIIKPCKCQLKFRLPYVLPDFPDEYEYFEGLLYKQPWAPETTTETRLVLTSPDFHYRKYSSKKYESQLFYHNATLREKKRYDTNIPDGIELVNDWDSCCEIRIWQDYLANFDLKGDDLKGEENEENSQKEKVLSLSKNATEYLTKDRKYSDTLSYLRSNPRAIKNRNFGNE
jgi:cap2 methyltransferase